MTKKQRSIDQTIRKAIEIGAQAAYAHEILGAPPLNFKSRTAKGMLAPYRRWFINELSPKIHAKIHADTQAIRRNSRKR